MDEQSKITAHQKDCFDMRLATVRRIGNARWNEQRHIGERIEQLMYEAKSAEACEVLLSLAYYVFEGDKR